MDGLSSANREVAQGLSKPTALLVLPAAYAWLARKDDDALLLE